MSLQPTPKAPMNPNIKSASRWNASSWITTVIIILLLAIAVMGIMTGKKFLEAQQTSINEVEIKDFTSYVNENPDSIDGRLMLAYSYQKAERYDEAREQYLEVLSVEPKNQGATYNLGQIAQINKDYKEAEARYTELLKNYQFHVLGAVGLANVYIENKKYDEAIALMDKMIGNVPRIVDFHLVKAQALEKKGDNAKAKESYKSALKFDPSNQAAKKALERLK